MSAGVSPRTRSVVGGLPAGKGVRMIHITDDISLHDWEIKLEFTRSSGPGGQNVNKVSTAAQLRFDVVHSPSIPEPVRQRLMVLVKNRLTKDGVIIIEARRHRTQERNRRDALLRLIGLIREAASEPRIRKKTSPGKRAKDARLASKRRRSLVKRKRGTVRSDEE